MEISLWIDEARPLPDVVAAVTAAARLGYPRVWFGQRTGWDPLTLITAVGDRVPDIALGTAVVVTWPRHPLVLAAQALSAQAATGDRVTLGIGPSHQLIVESTYGYRWERPGTHVREYLQMLRPLLRGESVETTGPVVAPGATAPPVLLAAHGPVLLRTAGELADGVITTWTGPAGLERFVLPAVTAASPGPPRVVVGVVASLTRDPDAARAYVAGQLGLAGRLPSYRRALDRDGYAGPEDTVLAGDEAALERAVERFAAAGATDFQLCPVGPPAERDRTVEFFGDLARRR